MEEIRPGSEPAFTIHNPPSTIDDHGVAVHLHNRPRTLRVPAGPRLVAPVRGRGPTHRGRVLGAAEGGVAAVRVLDVPPGLPRVPDVPVAPGAGRDVQAGPQPAAGA